MFYRIISPSVAVKVLTPLGDLVLASITDSLGAIPIPQKNEVAVAKKEIGVVSVFSIVPKKSTPRGVVL